MSTCGSVITDWKRLWQLVSGIHYETPESTVQSELENISKELQDGLLQFQPIKASNVKLEDLLKERKQEKLLPFTKRLQELLDLESKQCWEILCFYLTNEYRGSATSLTALISTEANMTQLLDDIWGYYRLERIIVLKIVKNLLVFYQVPTHPYHSEYKNIVNKLSLAKLRESYMNQLEHLINEVPPSKLLAGEYFNYKAKLVTWSERNAHEIIETLHILLLLCEHMPVECAHVQRLFNCFKQHAFGRQQRYLQANHSVHAKLMAQMTYGETIVLLKCLDVAATQVSLCQQITQALDSEMMRLYHQPEHGALLLSWMLLNLRATQAAEAPETLLKYQRMGKRAVDLNCFGFLHDLLTNVMFQDDTLVSRIARRTIYSLLSYMCDLFDGDGSCAKHPNIYELLSELLAWPTLAKQFSQDKDAGGVQSLYTTLLETFPMDFAHISMLAKALTKGGAGNFIKKELENLPILSVNSDDARFTLKSMDSDGEYCLAEAYSPLPHIDFTLPAGTKAVISQRCVHFRTCVNYFHVLHHEINCLLAEAQHGDIAISERVHRVNAGIEYLVVALQRTKTINAISVEMVHPTEMCVDILNKFKTLQNPPLELLANCLDVCTALLPLADEEIFMRVNTLSILPRMINDSLNDFKKYAHGVCFDSCLVGSFLVDVEKKNERYDFLLAYLRFLRTYTKLQRNHYFQIEIPGLIFLLREVFSHMHAWRFQRPMDKNEIYAEIMGFICDVLEVVTSQPKLKSEQHKRQCMMLRDICMYSMLSLENGVVLLRFVALGNAYLQHSMEMESNWMVQQTNGPVLLVRLAMRILMQVLRLKSCIFEGSELSPLEALIYTQPKQRDTLRIIPVVTSYMSNIFDRWLPILSCRLLRRIALEFNMSLLACLDMEPDQIRLTFLHRLPDDLESDSLKIAILELVEACIEKQPGVTEAFFKVNFGKENRLFAPSAHNAQIADSILPYMEDYLEAVDKEPETIEHNLPSKIMNIFHTLWLHNMQILVEDLLVKPKFWHKLCRPLFAPKLGSGTKPVRVYTQLMNILAIEIYSAPSKATSAELKEIVVSFFGADNFDNWLKFVFNLPKIPAAVPSEVCEFYSEDQPEWLCRLQAFKGLLMILMRKQPRYFDPPNKQMKLLAEQCLNVLVERAEYVEDMRPFILLAEMYLIVLQSFKHSYTENAVEDAIMLTKILKLLSNVASCYEDLHVRAKEANLAIAIRCADLLIHELLKDASVSLNFLHSVVYIVCDELQTLENCVKTEYQQQGKQTGAAVQSHSSKNTLILSLNLLKTVANILHKEGPSNWDLPFKTNKVFQRLLSCANYVLPLQSKHTLSVELLDVLIIFAKGNCSEEFLHCDVGEYLWLKLLPPKDLLQQENYTMPANKVNSDETWNVQHWWAIYARGIELVSTLCQKHEYRFLNESLQFVGIHQDYLIDCLLLGKQSLEPQAIKLIKSAITLLVEMVRYESHWRIENPQSLANIMRAVQLLMGYTISMFHQPRNLKSLVASRRLQVEVLRTENENIELIDEMIRALNDLMEILILSTKCLLAFSPPLMELICAPQISLSQWECIIEVNFCAPKISEQAVSLTFGTVLSIVGVFTKALNLQNYGFNEVPLNSLPLGDEIPQSAASAGNRSSTSNPPNSTSSASRPFSKSMSVTSISSVNCPSNELLTSLDSELCLMALEHVLTLAASQSMLTLKNVNLPLREKTLIRRDISSELIYLHEFVRKKILIDHREHKSMWHRRKMGQVPMLPSHANEDGSTNRGQAETARRPASDVRNSMRVNVVRRLHLQNQQQQQHQQQSRSPFEMTHEISPISGDRERPGTSHAVASTPNLQHPPQRRPNERTSDENPKRVYTHAIDEDTVDDCDVMDLEQVQEEDEEDIQLLPPEEAKYSPLSYVQLIEEDYLHFMSNLFIFICQSD